MGKGEVITETPKGMAGSLKGGRSSRQVRSGDGSGSSGGNASGGGQQRGGSEGVSGGVQSRKRSKMSSDNNDGVDVDVDASGSGGGGGGGGGTNAHHGNNRLHWAITCEDWEACKQMIAGPDGARLLKEKNRSGSTVLMMIASGQCGGKKSTDAAELLELILANPGGLASIPERRFSKTAADYAQHQGNVALAARLRALEPRGLVVSGIERCKCGERLKKRCKVDTLWDTVRRGAEENELVRSLFEQRPAVATELTRNEYHRVNGCKNFRKELSETMALVRALGNEIIKGVPEIFPEVLLAASANDGTSGSDDGDDVGSAGSSAASGKAGGATLPPLSSSSSTSTTATATATAIPSSTTALLASLPTTISSPPLEPRPATTPTVKVDTPLPPGPILVPWAAASQASKDWHVIDLCCGKSLTAAMVALLFEGAVVTCVDLCAPTQLPHYVEAGLGDRVNFVQVDMLAAGKKTDAAPPFFLKLAAAVKAAGKSKVAVLGVHCCGVLSVKAIELYEYLRADSIHLMPCCMPNKKDARFPAAIFESGVQATQYEAWARHLHSRLVTPTLELLPPAAAARNTKPTNGNPTAGVGGGGGGVGSGGSAALDAASPNAIKAAPVFELLTDVVSVKNALVSCRRNTNSTA